MGEGDGPQMWVTEQWAPTAQGDDLRGMDDNVTWGDNKGDILTDSLEKGIAQVKQKLSSLEGAAK